MLGSGDTAVSQTNVALARLGKPSQLAIFVTDFYQNTSVMSIDLPVVCAAFGLQSTVK